MKHHCVIFFLMFALFIFTNCQVEINQPTPKDPQPTDYKFLTKLMATDKAASDYFGFSVALSADGNTA